jgi:hypothetical protein
MEYDCPAPQENPKTWSRSCDHNFLRFLTIFGEKNWRFCSKPNVTIKILHNLALFCVKKRHFFRRIFLAKFFKNHNIVPRRKLLHSSRNSMSAEKFSDKFS